jgi:hypothetical protein
LQVGDSRLASLGGQNVLYFGLKNELAVLHSGKRKFFNPIQKPRKSPKTWAFSVALDFQAHICYIGGVIGIPKTR